MSVALVVRTDGRRDCILRAVPSLLEHITGPITERYIVDDSADSDYQQWLNRMFADFDIVCGQERRGFGGNIQRAWSHILNYSSCHYIFDTEDDFTYNRSIDLFPMMNVLDTHPHLVQLALRRQPWNEHEAAAGGIVEQHPDAYADFKDFHGNEWLEHRLFLTTNPSLHRYDLCQLRWPDETHSEGMFTQLLLRSGYHHISGDEVRFGFWGARDSGEWVTHIGTERIGSGY